MSASIVAQATPVTAPARETELLARVGYWQPAV